MHSLHMYQLGTSAKCYFDIIFCLAVVVEHYSFICLFYVPEISDVDSPNFKSCSRVFR